MIDHEQIVALHGQGMSNRRVADMVGCNKETVRRHLVRERDGNPQKRSRSKCVPVVQELMESGFSRIVAEGVTYQQLWWFVKRNFNDSLYVTRADGRVWLCKIPFCVPRVRGCAERA